MEKDFHLHPVVKKGAAPLQPVELLPEALSPRCNAAALGFETTDELPDLQDVIGQPRAFRALELGSEVSSPGYNTFVLGQPGSGRTTLSQEYLQRRAASEPVPDDWCYVNNYADPHAPKALHLPAGRGVEFRQDIDEFIDHCQREIPRLFDSEEYVHERERLIASTKKNQEAEFQRLQAHVEKLSFVILRTPFGFVLAPAAQKKPLTPEELESLSPEQRAKIEQVNHILAEDVEKTIERFREMEKSLLNQLKELNSNTTLFLIEPLIAALKDKYAGLDCILAHLEAMRADILENVAHFYPSSSSSPSGPQMDAALWRALYSVNLIVDHSASQAAPVIVENQPSYPNLLGRIEHEYVSGATRTDFTMIRAGALHRANGGYLILPARDVLVNPYAWEGLKRVLRDRSIRIIELGSQMGLLSTVTLEPEPIPMTCKVLLVGTPLLYYLLRTFDEDFAKLFKVRAEFATLMERSPETEREYGLFVKSVVDDNRLLPFHASAVARIIEHSSRLAEDQHKLSTCFGKIADLVCEADYWAKKDRQSLVTREAVQKAIDQTIYRNNLVEERIQELITQNTLLVEVCKRSIGEINALSVASLGDYAFGFPVRITAAVHPGKAGVIDIERQAELGGRIHTKGVLILSGYLASHYGHDRALGLAASLAFEQSYDEIEGDSASAAELFALLSALAEIPLHQGRAITGSINQHGQIQAIGGVNEKIEGFFAVCKAHGFTGEQGVILPVSNQRHLVLKGEVVEAVKAGKFHLWPVSTVEEGISILTGCEPGHRQVDGSFPPNTFNAAVEERLAGFAKRLEAEKASEVNPGKNGGLP